MRICKLTLICLFYFLLPSVLRAQNLFLQKIDYCDATGYCIDCGEPKASCQQLTLDYIAFQMNRKYNFNNGYASISFQVLIDSTGFNCVYSHSDVTNSPVTADLIRFLNGSLWRPARINGKPVLSSVNVVFTLTSGKMSGRIQRVDLSEMASPGNPTIKGNFNYTNTSLKNYDITVWTKYNSPLPDNVGRACVVDKSDSVWYATAKGLTRFDTKTETFNPVGEYNSPFITNAEANDIVVDNDNNKWIYAFNSIYKFGKAGWQIFDFKRFLVSGANRILNARSGELLLATKEGLVVARTNKLALLNKKSVPQLPSSDIYYGYDDGHKRLWIGTINGSIMMDGIIATSYNNTSTPLKNACITTMTEDEKGNLYFALKGNNPATNDDVEGIAVLTTDGQWIHYNYKNSGMPSNEVTSLLYDKVEHVLWIGTAQSGLVRFDLNGGWENYTNINSGMPGFAIKQLAQDSKGNIFAATANGMVRISKKR